MCIKENVHTVASQARENIKTIGKCVFENNKGVYQTQYLWSDL